MLVIWVKDAMAPLLTTTTGLCNSLRHLSSSQLSICIFITVALIVASSTFLHPEEYCHHTDDGGRGRGDHDMFTCTHVIDDQEPAAAAANDPPQAPDQTLSLSILQQYDSPRFTSETDHDHRPNWGEKAKSPNSPSSSSTALVLQERPPLLPAEEAAYAYEEIKKAAWSLAIYSPYSSSDDQNKSETENDHCPQPPLITSQKEAAEEEEKEDEGGPAVSHQLSDKEEEEEEDDIETTWKAITGGERKPKKKHLKKSKTWNAPVHRRGMRRLDSEEVVPSSPKWKELKKAMTFNDAVSMMRRGGLIRSDPSVSLHEFNKQVEDFIKKRHNHDVMMRF